MIADPVDEELECPRRRDVVILAGEVVPCELALPEGGASCVPVVGGVEHCAEGQSGIRPYCACVTPVSWQISNEAVGLHRFLTQRGRIGRRFGERFWEVEGNLGRGRTLLMIVCKKWHVAKRLTEAVRRETPIPAVDYLFNEQDAALPDMGGVEKTIEKRERHRKALVRILFDQFGSRQLAICLDPAALGLVQDFADDKAEVLVAAASRVVTVRWSDPASIDTVRCCRRSRPVEIQSSASALRTPSETQLRRRSLSVGARCRSSTQPSIGCPCSSTS